MLTTHKEDVKHEQVTPYRCVMLQTNATKALSARAVVLTGQSAVDCFWPSSRIFSRLRHSSAPLFHSRGSICAQAAAGLS